MSSNVLERIEKIGNKLSLPYIIFFELVLIARMVSVYSTLPTKIDSIFTLIIIVFSGIVFFCHFFPMILKKKKIQIEYWLVLFIVILVITTLINHSYAFTENIKLIIWQCIFFFCVFEVGRTNNQRIFKIFEYVLLIVWTVLTSIALYLFFAHVNFSMPVKTLYYGMRIGFYENRLYGIFVDPNYACTISLICILFAIRNIIKNKKIIQRTLYSFIALIQFSYVALSGSRSGIIQLMAATFFGVFFVYLYKNPTNRKFVATKLVQAVLSAIVCSAIAYGGVSFVQYGYIFLGNEIHVSSPKMLDSFEKRTPANTENNKLSAKRPDVEENTDISNSRFKLWKSATELMRLNPLFGVTPKGFVDVAKEKIPETHIARTGQTPHSAFFYLLAATGITGTIIFVVFLITKMVNSLRILFSNNNKDYIEFIIDNQVVLVILVSSLLITEIVLTRRTATFVFWLYLGKLQHTFDLMKVKLRNKK